MNPNLDSGPGGMVPEFATGAVEQMREQLFEASAPASLEAATDAWSEVATVFSPIPGDLRRITDQLVENPDSDENYELLQRVDSLVAFGEDIAAGLQFTANVVFPQLQEALNDAIYAAPYAQDSHDHPHPFEGAGSRALTTEEKLQNWHDHGFECPHDSSEFCALNPLYCDEFKTWNNEERYRDEFDAMGAALELAARRYEELIAVWPVPEQPPEMMPGGSYDQPGQSVGHAAWLQDHSEPIGVSGPPESSDPMRALAEISTTAPEPGPSFGGLMGGTAEPSGSSIGVSASSDTSVGGMAGSATSMYEVEGRGGLPGAGARGGDRGSGSYGPSGPEDLGEDLGGSSGSENQPDQSGAEPSNLERFNAGLDPTTQLSDGTLVLSPYFAEQIPDQTWQEMAEQIPPAQWENMAGQHSDQVAPQLAAHAPPHLFDQFACNQDDFQARTDAAGNPLPVGVNIPADSVEYVPSHLSSLVSSYDYTEARTLWESNHWGDNPPQDAEVDILIDSPIGDPLLPVDGEASSGFERPWQSDSDDIYR